MQRFFIFEDRSCNLKNIYKKSENLCIGPNNNALCRNSTYLQSQRRSYFFLSLHFKWGKNEKTYIPHTRMKKINIETENKMFVEGKNINRRMHYARLHCKFYLQIYFKTTNKNSKKSMLCVLHIFFFLFVFHCMAWIDRKCLCAVYIDFDKITVIKVVQYICQINLPF